MSGLAFRQGKRSYGQRFITDPLVGAMVWGVLGVLKILPFSWALGLARGTGKIAYYLTPKRQKIGLYNLNQAFPDKPLTWKKNVLKGVWQNLGSIFLIYARAKDFFNILEIPQTESLQILRHNRQGGFLLSAHLGCWELITFPGNEKMLTTAINPVYRPANNPYLEKMLFHKRAGILLPKGLQGARQMIKILQNNQYVGILNDQKLNEGTAVPFFGKMAMTAPAVVKIALKYHKPIFPMFMVWTGPKTLKWIVEKPLTLAPGKNEDEIVYNTLCKMNQIFEHYIRQYPAQWMWIHRRYHKCEYKI